MREMSKVSTNVSGKTPHSSVSNIVATKMMRVMYHNQQTRKHSQNRSITLDLLEKIQRQIREMIEISTNVSGKALH